MNLDEIRSALEGHAPDSFPDGEITRRCPEGRYGLDYLDHIAEVLAKADAT